MDKAARNIVICVVAYSLLDTLLLLACLGEKQYPNPSPYQAIVFSGQLFLIPGMAAILSRIMYGPRGWASRALKILGVGAFGVPGLMAALVAINFAIDWFFSVNWDSSIPIVLFIGLLLLAGIGFTVGVFFLLKGMAKRRVQLEASRWLSERQSGVGTIEQRSRSRAIRWAVCAPSGMVLLSFLFLPEIWGVLSHVRQPHAGTILGYSVPVPHTWIVLEHNRGDRGWSFLSGIVGRGMAFTPLRYLHGDLPLSIWSIRTTPEVEMDPRANDDEITNRRVFRIARENLTCVEYWPHYLPRPKDNMDLPNAHVRCSGSIHLSADFVGERLQLPQFYEMLDGITPQFE